MSVDVLSLLICIVLVVLGWRSGALRQLLRMMAVIALVLGAPFISPIIRELLFQQSGTASPGIEVLCLFLAGLAIYLSVSLGAWLMIKILRAASPTLGLLDRVGGASIGALKAAILIYLGIGLIVLLHEPLRGYDPDNKLGLREGILTNFVHTYNVMAPWQFPDLGRLHQALRVGVLVQELGAFEAVRDEPDAAELLRDERVEELLADQALMEWVASDQYPMTLADGRVRDLLNDKKFVKRLKSVNWAVLKALVQERWTGKNDGE